MEPTSNNTSPSVSTTEQPFSFAEEEEATGAVDEKTNRETWKVLSVEDNVAFQDTLEMSIANMSILGRPTEFLKAGSLAEASMVLANNIDIMVILMDVVMETDDAGLRLVRAIREVMGNSLVRIVLLTGQPGMAPQQDIMQEYDIDDYWCKSELTHERLATLLTGNIRSWLRLSETLRARKGLQMIVDSSRHLMTRYDMPTFSEQMLKELEQLFDIDDGGTVCLRKHSEQGNINEATIIAASGRYRSLLNQPISEIEDQHFHKAIEEALAAQGHVITSSYSMLYFADEVSKNDYLAYLPTKIRPLDETEIELMRVFTTNIQTGLRNIHLFNRISELAYWDKDLNIPNRHALMRELSIHFNRQHKEDYLLLVIDLNGFANTNLVFGQDYGDQLLKAVSDRLSRNFPSDVFVSRISADTFALLGTHKLLSAEAVHALFNTPFQLDSNEQLTSVCIAEIPLAAMPSNPRRILDMAGPTLTRAKEMGPGRTAVFNPLSVHDAEQRFHMMIALRSTLENENGLTIALQPKISLSSGKVVGFEALARWFDESGNAIQPGIFIPLAESSGLVVRLGERILQLTCQAVKQLQQIGYNVPVSFNASAEELGRDDFLGRLTRIIAEEQILYEWLDLEITETAAMNDFATVSSQLKRLLNMGMSVSIDDFGTGYSSLNYLTIFPAKILKIDRSFVQKLGHDANVESVVEAILKLANQLQLKVVAEGVETEEQSQWLATRDCDVVQGFLYAKPMTLDVLLPWLQERKANI